MTDVLARIVERKRREVAQRLGGRFTGATPTMRSLRKALGQPGARFIMEVKRKSPSGHRSRIAIEEAAAAYAPVADSISVLTDGEDFGGSLDDLRTVRALFEGPILAKDFIVAPEQVSEARAAGADAVLAMLSVLTDEEAASVMAEAARLAMDVIVEVHDEAELKRALALGAAIVGINNRDLKTLKTDLAVAERLAPMVPPGVLVIAESGIADHKDVERLAPLADAFLVGSSLMASANIAEAARALVHGRTKICGLTRIEDVELAGRSGATHAGLILVPGTPRNLDPALAGDLAAAARHCGMKAVGVFRDRNPREVARLADALALDAVQLHGDESEADVAELKKALPSTEVWAACGVGNQAGDTRPNADRQLFDTRRSGRFGGTGVPFDWSLLTGKPELPAAFVAGGIAPRNAEAAKRIGAYGLDIGSGVEASSGRKDQAQVEALFAALRPTARCGR
jgi:indole-3-glycerol phosphate synthase/phosphoribosylanthranilate isomerase